MKITLIGPVYPYRGGIAHFTTQLAMALQTEKHTVQVFSFKRQYPKWLYPGQSDRDPSREPVRVEAKYLLDPLYPWTWGKTVKEIRLQSPDLVLIQWWTTFWALAIASIVRGLRTRGIRTGFLVHNVLPHETRPWDRALAKMALRRGDYFIVMSSRQQEMLQKLIPNARIELVEHPVYDLFAGQKKDRAAARQKLGLPNDLPIALFFGIVRPYKGLSVLLEAGGQLAAEGIPLGLYIAGEFWEDEKKYRDQIERLGIADRVWIDNRYIPNEDVPIIFSAADLFVAPYTGGTQSGAVKMALGFGLPVVVSSTLWDESLRPWLDRRVFSCQPNSLESFQDALKEGLKVDMIKDVDTKVGNNWTSFIRILSDLVQGSSEE